MKRVLIVEDDSQMATMLVESVTQEGWSASHAENGIEALRACESEAPDAIVMDIILPEKEGIETIIEIRGRWPKLPIVAISGGGRGVGVDYLDIAAKVGANHTLAKPFDVDDLVELLRGYLEES
jgi:DNA-binding response OmpR family regulator